MPPPGMKVVCDGDTCRLVPDDGEDITSSTTKLTKGEVSDPQAPAVAKAINITKLVDATGQPVPLDILKDKMVGLYFSASWCGPCQAFSPKLSEFCGKNTKDFVVVFVSLDNSEEDMMKFISGKNFLSL
eukprot:Ihof_evm10s90 gene=Ihof_evmTU10s90